MWRAMILSWAVALQCFIHCVLGDVFSCGGFVKSPNIPIDYTKIQVKLLTAEGNLKYETECNPSNGYYMIPVYNKASYSIRVFAPEGWFFEPSSVELKVDGKTDACTLNEDINFVLSAFAVEGVLRSGDGDGPAGVALSLLTADGKPVVETKTLANGVYRFRAPPGKYMVSTADGSAECIERGKVAAEVIASPIRVSPDLKISGHLLTVKVLSKNRPLAGVTISLFSKSDVKLPYCSANTEAVSPTADERYVCAVKSNAAGIALFRCLPPAIYSVLPTFGTDRVQFSFSPKLHLLKMGSAAESITFDMRGFRSRGRVMLGKMPIANADVLVNSVVKVKTDSDGWYALEELQEEEYAITARKEHYSFSTVKAKLSANNAEIADVVATKVDVCGNVEVEEGGSRVMTLFITNERSNDPQSVRSDSNGKFCRLVAPDIYLVAPSGDSGLVMTPKQRRVDLTAGPVLNVLFTQFKATVEAKVSCLDQCGKLKLELWNGDELVKTVEGTERFQLTGISPDSYQLKMEDEGRFCWESSVISFVVERSNVDDLLFRQIGYRATVSLSHPAKMKWQKTEQKQLSGSLELPAGLSSFCVPLAGVYSLSFEACHLFEESAYELVIPQEKPVTAKAVKFLVTASVTAESSLTAQSSDFALTLRGSTDEKIIQVSGSSTGRKFDFSFYLPLSESGSDIFLIPQSTTYLFKPSSFAFRFTGECHEEAVSFIADKGVFVEGSVSPPIEGVLIRAPHKTDSNIVLKTLTDSVGRFRMGPVRKLDDFEIIAEKEGYKFLKTDKPGVLSALKLSQLRIVIVDAATAAPLGNVLLSLSGANNYRSNSIIDASGIISFVGLSPGEYFIRPILQEYRFEPPTLTITVKEGEVETAKLEGKRFAFSVFGKVTHLAGQPVPSVLVEAVSEQCSQLQEEDTTSEKGTFRIRGLHPNCSYRLTLKSDKGQRVHSYPAYYDITVTNEEVKDVNFVLTEMESHLEVLGDVHFVGTQSPSQFRVVLYKQDSAVQYITVTSPSTVFFFDAIPIDGSEYAVRFEATHSSQGQRFDSSEVSFIADKTFKAITLEVRPQKKSFDVEISGGSYFALPFFLLVAFVFFNHQKVFTWLESGFSRVSSLSIPRRSPTPTDEHSDALRRRNKLKKT